MIGNQPDDLGEMWMGEEHLKVLPEAVQGYDESSVLLEMGTWKGRSCILFLESNPKIRFHCLDSWHLGGHDEFIENIERHGVKDRVVKIKDYSKNVARYFPAANVDFIYLDACHKEESVYNDLATCRAILKPGGIVLGDDWQMETVRRAVERAMDHNLYEGVEFNEYTYFLRPTRWRMML